MPIDSQSKNNKAESKVSETDARFVVMPKEFRKVAPKKNNKKFFIIIGGIFLALLAVVIAIVLALNNFKSQSALISEDTKNNIPLDDVKPISEQPIVKEEPQTSDSLSTPKATSTSQISGPIKPAIPIGQLKQGTDSDSDGLTDKEEPIYQSDFKRPDTDADGFLDGNEVFHLYNPAAVAPVTMLESGTVRLYRNASLGYELFYPTLWSTSSTVDGGMVSFLSGDLANIHIRVVDTSQSITLRSWYLSEFPNEDINKMQTYVSKQGYSGLQDEGRLNTYIKQGSKVFIITYDLGGDDTIWYRRVYDMILNSLVIE